MAGGETGFVEPVALAADLNEVAVMHQPVEERGHRNNSTKRGKLKGARAAALRSAGVSWRVVFVVSISQHRVRVLSVAPHDAW